MVSSCISTYQFLIQNVNSYSTAHGWTMQMKVISIKCVIPVDSSSKWDLLIKGAFFTDAVCNMKHSLEEDTEKMRSAKKEKCTEPFWKWPHLRVSFKDGFADVAGGLSKWTFLLTVKRCTLHSALLKQKMMHKQSFSNNNCHPNCYSNQGW